MSRIDDARALLRGAGLPAIDIDEDTYFDVARGITRYIQRVDTDVLVASLTTFVELERGGQGRSQRGDVPLLPTDWTMPDGWDDLSVFLQIDLGELAAVDPEARLPPAGMMTVFQDDEDQEIGIHLAAPDAALVARDDVPWYEYENGPERLRLVPRFTCLVNGGASDYRWIHRVLPNPVRVDLERILGCRMAEWVSYDRLFGRPIYWQGEDEHHDGDPPPAQTHPDGPQLLLLQQELDDVAVNYWGHAGALKRGDFAGVWCTHSTT
jgi:hypothetical protein